MFAQVTNPPIDAIREEIVTSTSVYVGKDGNLLEQKPENCQVLKINNPILTNTDMMKIKSFKHEGFKTAVVSTLYYKSTLLRLSTKKRKPRFNQESIRIRQKPIALKTNITPIIKLNEEKSKSSRLGRSE